ITRDSLFTAAYGRFPLLCFEIAFRQQQMDFPIALLFLGRRLQKFDGLCVVAFFVSVLGCVERGVLRRRRKWKHRQPQKRGEHCLTSLRESSPTHHSERTVESLFSRYTKNRSVPHFLDSARKRPIWMFPEPIRTALHSCHP